MALSSLRRDVKILVKELMSNLKNLTFWMLPMSNFYFISIFCRKLLGMERCIATSCFRKFYMCWINFDLWALVPLLREKNMGNASGGVDCIKIGFIHNASHFMLGW